MSNKHYRNRGAAKIQKCADQHYWSSDDDPASIVRDMLADMRHYCDEHKLCFGDLDKEAHKYYQEELAEDNREEGYGDE